MVDADWKKLGWQCEASHGLWLLLDRVYFRERDRNNKLKRIPASDIRAIQQYIASARNKGEYNPEFLELEKQFREWMINGRPANRPVDRFRDLAKASRIHLSYSDALRQGVQRLEIIDSLAKFFNCSERQIERFIALYRTAFPELAKSREKLD